MSNQYRVSKSYEHKKECNYGECDYYEEDYHKKNKHVDCNPNKIIFDCEEICGTNILATIPEGRDTVTTKLYELGKITVKDLCCFKKPCVKLDLSSVVGGIITGISNYCVGLVSLKFIIEKRCDKELEFRTFKEIDALSLPIVPLAPLAPLTPLSLTQGFSICDCEEICRENNCCEYRVSVVVTLRNLLASHYGNDNGGYCESTSGNIPALNHIYETCAANISIGPGTLSVTVGDKHC